MKLPRIPVSTALCLLLTTAACAQTWPTYRHDNRRSGVTEAPLTFPLSQDWVWRSPQPPQTAWTGPAKWDAYSGNEGLQSMRNFDPCFYVTADNEAVYFGSSVDDAVHALDIHTGAEKWAFITGAAVRMPPTVADGKVLFGSDDGTAYCCDAKSGSLLWKKFAAAGKDRITSNRKIISLWPIRTGVLVDGGKATFAASLVPWEPSLLWTVNVSDGHEVFQSTIDAVTLQGAMLASQELFYVPQGRAAPLAFARDNGEPRGSVGQAGGVFCILTEDELLLAGPNSQKADQDEIRIGSVASGEAIATFAGTNRILVEGNFAWIAVDGKLKMLDRAGYVAAQQLLAQAGSKQAKKEYSEQQLKDLSAQATAAMAAVWQWEIDSPAPVELIKAADVLLIGLADEVVAISAVDGQERWRRPVDGTAHGLAVAGGRLFVSTDRGVIHAFGAAK